jgi:hypothetical protein
VKKNGIMMVDFALEAERNAARTGAGDLRGLLERFRPILMTTLAAMLGALPLVLGTGPGSELRRRSASPSSAAAGVADADALHDAGDLSDARPAASAALGRARAP